MVQNVTTSMNGIATTAATTGWMVTIIVFIGIIMVLILLFKNLRHFIFGAVVTAGLLITYWISRGIGVEAEAKNYEPFKWCCYIIGFIIISIVLGKWLKQYSFFKKIDEFFEVDKEVKPCKK